MLKRLMAMVTVILVLTLAASVAIAGPLQGKGSLTIVLNYNNGSTPVSDVGLKICLVANAFEDGGRIAYKLVEDFAGVPEAAVLMEGVPDDGEENAELAKMLEAYANTAGVMGETTTTDQYGKAVFSGLPAGIYLLAQSGSADSEYLIGPVLLPIPFEDESGWNSILTASPKVEYRLYSLVVQETEPEPELEPELERENPPPPPEPSDDTHTLIPNGSGSYIELDEDGTPQGEWQLDDDEWIFDDTTPLSNLPQTGTLRWPIPVLCSLGIVMVAFGFAINKKQKSQ